MNDPSSRLNIRLLIITQLSNALRYLESEKIVHQDVAARNCLIYPNYEIKLMNFGMVSTQFQSHYCKINDCRLPIRWMAPETISNVINKFLSQLVISVCMPFFFRVNSVLNLMFGLLE